MTKVEEKAMRRIRFAECHKLSLEQVKRLCRLANAAHHAGEQYCSIDRPGLEAKLDKAQASFEKAAQACGFGAEWPGLWPLLTKDGREVHLPE